MRQEDKPEVKAWDCHTRHFHLLYNYCPNCQFVPVEENPPILWRSDPQWSARTKTSPTA